MAKNSISDFDIVPENNTDIGGIDIRGTASVQNFDNAFRTLMAFEKVVYNGTSTFMRTVLDDADAAAARVTLGVEKILRYDAPQTLTGADLTLARANLRAIGVRTILFETIVAAGATSAIYDLPDDVSDFRVRLNGLTAQSGDANITVRCGVVGASVDAGDSDYIQQFMLLAGGTTSDSGGLASSAPIGGIGANGFSRFEIEGDVGSATSAWNAFSRQRTLDSSANSISMRGFARQALGRRARIAILSSAPLASGEIIVEGV